MSTVAEHHPMRGLHPRELIAQGRLIAQLIKDAADGYSKNEGYRLGAAFSYYATFSIFPLLLLATTTVGFVLGDSAAARERLLGTVANPGTPVYEVVDRTLSSLQASEASRGLSALIGLGTLLFGASGAFVELYTAMNRIWCVPERQAKGILASIRAYAVDRLVGFAIVAALGLSLLLSLVSSSVLTYVADRAHEHVSVPLWPGVVRTAEVTLTLALLSVVFTAAFHFLPRTRPPFRIVVGGAVLTTVFLLALKEVFASYLSHLTKYSAYGVVGGFLGLATWIYVSSQIILFGAQLTRTHAEKVGETALPCR